MRGLHDSTGDEASWILTPPPFPLSLDHQPPVHPSRPPLERQISKNRRYTHVKCNRQPADKGPLARDAATHIEHCVRSIYSSSGAASLASGAPLSNECGRSVEPRGQQRVVARCGSPGSGIAVHNVKCGVWSEDFST